MMNDYVVHVTDEEYIAMRDLVTKMRKEKAKQQAIEEQEQQIGEAISVALSIIGLEETKRIVRQVAKDLRSKTNKTDDPCNNCEQCIMMRDGIHTKCPKTGLFDNCEKLHFLSNFSCSSTS